MFSRFFSLLFLSLFILSPKAALAESVFETTEGDDLVALSPMPDGSVLVEIGTKGFSGTSGGGVFYGIFPFSEVVKPEDGPIVLHLGAGNDEMNVASNITIPFEVYGGPGNDYIFGSDADDYLVGGEGDDYIDGREGNDTMDGEGGIDTMRGGAGDDTILGGADKDVISGGFGADTIYGGDGPDILNGNEGNDVICGNDGDDVLKGEFGKDRLIGNKGDDTLIGGLGRDILRGGPGRDRLLGSDVGGSDYRRDRLFSDDDDIRVRQ